MPRPSGCPTSAGRSIAVASGGWRILAEPELHFQRNTEVVVPDIAGWRRERLREIPQDQRFEVVPDWVCDILSVPTAGIDREVKMPVYASYGVQFVWLVDPRAQTVEAYRLDAGAWSQCASFAGDAPIRAAPFEAVAVPAPWSAA